MFDRGLVSVDDDHSILAAKAHLPQAVTRLLRKEIIVPSRPETHPNPVHLRYHRDSIFKG
jgi:putative restriction endonuclease